MAKQIQIRILPDGTIQSETFNMKGKECLKYIKIVEQLLQARVVDSDFTKEYYETKNVQETLENTEMRLENGNV